MKIIIRYSTLAVLFFLIINKAVSQSNFTQTLTYRINSSGGSSVELTQKMNAQQWQMFKANVNSSNLSVKKRDIERILPMYVLENFKYSEDQMERTSIFNFDLLGFAEYTGDNKWTVKLETKKPQIEKLADNCYMITTSVATNDGGVYQQIHKVFLPAKASGIEVNKDALDYAKIDYNLKSETQKIPFMLIGGGLLCIAGAGLFFMQKKPASPKSS